jgi:hypothetical protein
LPSLTRCGRWASRESGSSTKCCDFLILRIVSFYSVTSGPSNRRACPEGPEEAASAVEAANRRYALSIALCATHAFSLNESEMLDGPL